MKTTPTPWDVWPVATWREVRPVPSSALFHSDLFESGYEAVREVDSRLATVADWKEPLKAGVIYYLRDGRVHGVLLWNLWGRAEAARKLIAEPGPFTAENLKDRLT